MAYRVNVGDPVPQFAIRDNDGYELTSEDLVGSPVVLYFYPKDETPGCTKEACDFRDQMDQLDALDALVIGISPDDAKSHAQFTQNHDLNYTLLSDTSFIMSRAFDILHNDRIERSTFVIDSEGIVQWIERPVNVEGHVKRVINAVQSLKDSDIFYS